MENCGGNCTYKDGIKCCEDCITPHKRENYELIINKINKYNKRPGDGID